MRQDAAAAAVGQVFNQIRQGQVIVRKGDRSIRPRPASSPR